MEVKEGSLSTKRESDRFRQHMTMGSIFHVDFLEKNCTMTKKATEGQGQDKYQSVIFFY